MGLTHSDLVLDAGELLLGLGQLGVGLLQGLPLGRHIAVDLVEADDVDAPGAQARGSRGLGADELGVEGRVALVGPGERATAGWGCRLPPPCTCLHLHVCLHLWSPLRAIGRAEHLTYYLLVS